MNGKDPDMVGLGSYLVNVSETAMAATLTTRQLNTRDGNPYLLLPVFNGTKQINREDLRWAEAARSGCFPGVDDAHPVAD